MTRGERLRIIRVGLDLSLREVARATDLTPVQLGEIERDVASAADLAAFAELAIIEAMARLVEPRLRAHALEFRDKLTAMSPVDRMSLSDEKVHTDSGVVRTAQSVRVETKKERGK